MNSGNKKYGLLFISIIIVGVAITLITNAGLGATAITSLAFVISELFGISFGFMTGCFNVLWVILQILILGKKFPRIQLLQFFVAALLGLSVDLSNSILGFIQPENYVYQIIMLVIGCLVMGFGVYLQLQAKSVYNPAEGIVAVLPKTAHSEFGRAKIVFDTLLVMWSMPFRSLSIRLAKFYLA